MAKSITVKGQRTPLQTSPISGDVAVTHEGVSTIGSGKITADMLSSALLVHLVPVAVVGTAVVSYSKVG